MEVPVLLAGMVFVVAVGWLAVSRLGRFLDGGGISPAWDEAEDRAAKASHPGDDGPHGISA